jgi:hypothetical protein
LDGELVVSAAPVLVVSEVGRVCHGSSVRRLPNSSKRTRSPLMRPHCGPSPPPTRITAGQQHLALDVVVEVELPGVGA